MAICVPGAITVREAHNMWKRIRRRWAVLEIDEREEEH